MVEERLKGRASDVSSIGQQLSTEQRQGRGTMTSRWRIIARPGKTLVSSYPRLCAQES